MKAFTGLKKGDAKLAGILERAGLHHNVAHTLVYIQSKKETTSKEIQNVTKLRQPEVSIAIQELRKREWVDKKDFKKDKGKGRPIHQYFLNIDFKKVLEHFVTENKKRIKSVESDIADLLVLKKKL
ncbi:MAG TPA: ArsR family transcriptional regulator [Euryarchaeota archaeon]|nr:ArsR family transcriptional regulator [Euryarchaeota archaeon]